ncbi:MAG: septal ring lytic transglycosylase RlpA family protein [bacterium]
MIRQNRFYVIPILVWLASGCAYSGGVKIPGAPKPQQDTAPRLSPAVLAQMQQLPDPQVLDEPRSRRGNGPVYTVWGKSYRVMDSAEGFVQEGTASWYGTKFHGRETSSGEVYDIYRLTAAHKHLPLPTYVRVTNLANGKETVVKVNDRGPFIGDRIIDLSYAAAVKLGFHEQGTSRVRVEVLEPFDEPETFMVQAGAFSEFERADRSHRELQALTGFKGVVVKMPADGFYRVRLGPVSADDIPRLQNLLQAADYGMPKLIPAPQGAR